MYAIAELDPCPFEDLCQEYHPEEEEERNRRGCSCENCRKCARYWAYHDGYNSLDEI